MEKKGQLWHLDPWMRPYNDALGVSGGQVRSVQGHHFYIGSGRLL